MTEFRKYGRSPLPGRVKLKHRELGEILVEDGNISATGLFLKIRRCPQFAVGDEFAAEFPHAANEPLTPTRVRVVRITSDGVGVAFV